MTLSSDLVTLRAIVRGPQSDGVFVLDVVFIAGILALVAVVAVVAKGVEKL